MKISQSLALALLISGSLSIGSCGDGKKSASESTILNDSTNNVKQSQTLSADDVNYASGVIATLSLKEQLGVADSDINAEEIAKSALAFMNGEISEAKTKELSDFSKNEASRLMELKKSGKQGKMDSKMNTVVGLFFGTNLKMSGITKEKFNKAEFTKGITDAIAGNAKYNLQTAQATIQQYVQQTIAASAGKNAEDGKKFLAENLKKNPNLKTTASGIQYEILKAGSGEKPKATDQVTTHYRGTLIDGSEFDSSFKRGTPADFPINGVIKGWTEILQLMPKGSKWKVYIPSNLAYGEQGPPNIGPNQTLIFEIELLKINGK